MKKVLHLVSAGKDIRALFLVAMLFTLLASLSTEVFGQAGDVIHDRIPDEYLSKVPATIITDAPPVTVDGYDNFFLGTDFAECHISENPQKPGEYFVAYNINGTHYTLNGYDWVVNNPSFGATMRGDPVTAYDSLGRLIYENMYGSPSILGTRVITSTNNGVSWQTPVNGNAGRDKNWIAADQTAGPYSNYIYSSMTNSGFSGVNFVRSTNNGASFSSTTSFSFSPLPGAMMCVGPNGSTQGGTVYFVGNSGNSFASTYRFYRSTNGGTSFTPVSNQNFANYIGTRVNGRNSVQNMRVRPYPFIAADNSYGTNRGRLYCIYASNSPAGNGNKPDVFCRYSDNGGVTWSSPVTVNDDANSQNHNQFQPATWCDKETGRLYVQWMDTRDTPTSDSALIYASYSDDGGQTFVTNQQISNKKMRINCSSCGGGGTPRYQGDYTSIISNSKTSMSAWTDFRSGTFGSYVAYFPDFAMTVSPAVDSVGISGGVGNYSVQIPGVKLFTDVASFSAVVTPTPSSGSISVAFPSGNTISSFPGSVPMTVSTSGGVTEGTYTVTVTGKGSNGTPIHKRTVTLVVSSVVSITNNTVPVKYELSQNFPNPFNPSTTIQYSLIEKTDVKLTFYNTLGEVITKYVNEQQQPGNYSIVFNARNLPSGVYYYKLEASGFTDIKKMLLVK